MHPVSVKQLLQNKPERALVAVSPEDTVFEALKKMYEENIGAVLVIKDGCLNGIFSERDYARKVVLQNRNSKVCLVKDVMTSKVIYVTPDQTAEECMALMTEKRIRHLPVLQKDTILGVVSIGDLVCSQIEEQKQIIAHLVHYIHSS